ncbi:hypothetical protein RND81_06G066000 [Saponaria officinalis]|uniref:Uncharacterized protein n=1 Tax=Saponaria officinalis TaxID=3572 RepID=A0AAW1K9T3_SAPOF
MCATAEADGVGGEPEETRERSTEVWEEKSRGGEIRREDQATNTKPERRRRRRTYDGGVLTPEAASGLRVFGAREKEGTKGFWELLFFVFYVVCDFGCFCLILGLMCCSVESKRVRVIT